MSFERFQVNEPSDFVAVAPDIFDLNSLIEFSRNAIEGLICMLFRVWGSTPLKEPDQGAPQIFIFFTSLFLILSETIQQLGEGFGG